MSELVVPVEPPDASASGTRTTSSALLVKGEARLLVMSGQVSVDDRGRIVGGGDLSAQMWQIYKKIAELVDAAGGAMRDLVYTRAYLPPSSDVGRYKATKAELARHYWDRGPYPANTLVVVLGLAEPEYLIEVEAMAAIR